jgi:anaerobic selenocysteine-containing dehydrogenase
VGEEGVLGTAGAGALPLEKLEALVVLGWRRDRLVEAAQVALPLCDFAEVDGTFTNRHGIVQRLRAAVPPAGDSLPGWEIISLLSDRLGMPMDFQAAAAPGSEPRPVTGPDQGSGKSTRGRAPTARTVFLEAKSKLPFMKDAEWGRSMLPTQLRFANTRG